MTILTVPLKKFQNCFNSGLEYNFKRTEKYYQYTYYFDLALDLSTYELITTVFISPFFSICGIIFSILILKIFET